MLIRDRMSRKVIVIRPQDTLEKARALLQRHRIRQLPVLSGKQLVGMITDRDLRGAPPAAKTVAKVMTPEPIVVAPDASIDEAARLLRARKINALPVMERGKLLGVLTVTDVLSAFIDISGVTRPSYRIVVAAEGGKQTDNAVRKVIEPKHGEVKWMYRDRKRSSLLHLRLKARSIGDVVAALEGAGFEVHTVVAPPRHSS